MAFRLYLSAGLALSIYTEPTLDSLITPLYTARNRPSRGKDSHKSDRQQRVDCGHSPLPVTLTPECLLFSPKQPLRNTHLDSVRMAAFGHKQSFGFYAYTCILTVNERPLSAKSGHSQVG